MDTDYILRRSDCRHIVLSTNLDYLMGSLLVMVSTQAWVYVHLTAPPIVRHADEFLQAVCLFEGNVM